MKLDNEEKKQNNDGKSNRSNFKWLNKIKNKSSARKSKIIFNLDGLGEIEFAKMHREANRPLNKIKEFDKNTKFCPCCSLPIEQKGYIERFNFCDNTDKFSECGRGISLYFSYFRFAILILCLAFTSVALPAFYLTYYSSKELVDVCNKIYELHKNDINITYPECLKFIKLDDDSTINFGEWVLYFNSVNLESYRLLLNKLSNSSNKIEKVLYNYSFMYFISLLSLFILNLMYIVLLFNRNKQYDILVTSPSDYTIMIRNIDSAFHIFWKKINKLNDIISGRVGCISSDRTSKSYNEIQKKANKLKVDLGIENFALNKEINILEAFHQFIKNKICDNSNDYIFQINQINICYKISEYMKIEEKIQDLKKQLVIAIFAPYQQRRNDDLDFNERKYFYPPFTIFGFNIFCFDVCQKSKFVSDIQEEKAKLEKKLEELIKKTESLNEENFSGCIFITFETMKEPEKFLETYPKNFVMSLLIKIKNIKYFLCRCFISREESKRFFLKRNLDLHIAPEPEDIIFENLEYSSMERNLRILFIYFLSFIIIGFCFFVIFEFNRLQIEKNIANNKRNKNLIKYSLSLLITGVISLINIVFEKILGHLTKIEKHISMTDHYLSLSIKLTLFTFINSAIVPLISDSYVSKEGNYELLVLNITTYFLTHSLITPLIWTFNFRFLYKKIKICCIEKSDNHNMTQRELNEIYELPDMAIAYKYSYIFKTLLMSFFYMPIFPLSTFISSVGLFFGYFMEKFNFSKMYKRPEMLNSKICEFYSNYFIINLFMLTIGDYIFTNRNIPNNKWTFINLTLFGILILIPYNQIFSLDFLGINESDLKQEKYKDIFLTFYNDYERSNPMTKKEGIKHFINKLIEKNFVEENRYKEIMDNIENINLMELYYESKKSFRQNSIKRSYTHKSTIIQNKNKTSYILNFNNFVKNNKEIVLNYLLSLVKKKNTISKNNIIEDNIKEEKQEEINNKDNKDNHFGLEVNEIKNKPEDLIYDLATNRNYYKESEQKINLKNSESFYPIQLNVRKNIPTKNVNTNSKNQSKNILLNNKRKVRFTIGKKNNNENINDHNNKNINDDNKYDIINNNNNNINYKIDEIKDIEIYNRYKKNKKHKKKFDFKFSKYSKNIKTNAINNNLKNTNNNIIININRKNNNPKIYNEISPNQDISPFNFENYDELHQKILNQYKSSTKLNSIDEYSGGLYRKEYEKKQKNIKIKKFDVKNNIFDLYNFENI